MMTKKSKETDEGCRVWTGCKDKTGYGRMWVNWRGRKEMRAHRIAYMLHHNLTPDTIAQKDEKDNQLVCSHICFVKACVRHVVLETNGASMERLHCKNQGVCTQGHEPYCLFLKAKEPYVEQQVILNSEDEFEETAETVHFVPGFTNKKKKTTH